MGKGLPGRGRASMMPSERRPSSLCRHQYRYIYSVAFIILMLSYLTSPTNAQHRSGDSGISDTLAAGDFGKEGFFERENSGIPPSGSDGEELFSNDYESRIKEKGILRTIMGFMGVRYRKNGEDSSGFDCSGFTSRIFYETCRILMPHSSQSQYEFGKHIDRENLRFGDLVFFALRGSFPSHVGIYIGDGLFAHASIKRGVTVSLLDSEYYARRFFGACRILE